MKAGRKSRYLSIQHTLRGQDSRTLLKPRFKGCSRLLGVGPGHSTSRHLGPGPGLSTVGSSGDSARTPFCLAAEFRIEHFQILAIQVKRSKRWAHSSLIVCTNISKKGPVEALGRPGPLGQVAQKVIAKERYSLHTSSRAGPVDFTETELESPERSITFSTGVSRDIQAWRARVAPKRWNAHRVRLHGRKKSCAVACFPCRRRGLVLWPQLLDQGLVLLHQRGHFGLMRTRSMRARMLQMPVILRRLQIKLAEARVNLKHPRAPGVHASAVCARSRSCVPSCCKSCWHQTAPCFWETGS